MRLTIQRIRRRIEGQNESRFLRLPTVQACALLAVLLGIMEGYTFTFVLQPWCFILPCYPLVNFLIGLLVLLRGRNLFSILYLIALLPTMIPLAIIIYYTAYVHSHPGDWNFQCKYGDQLEICKQYIYYLERLPRGTVLAAAIVGCLAVPVYVMTLIAFWRLRKYQRTFGTNLDSTTPVYNVSPSTPVSEVVIPQPIPIFQHQETPGPSHMFIPEPPPAYSGPYGSISYGAPPVIYQPTPSSGTLVHLPIEKEKDYRKMSL